MPKFMPRGYGYRRYVPRRKSYIRFPARRTTIPTQEKKFKDIDIDGNASADNTFGTTWALADFNGSNSQHSPLSTIAQGTGDSDRIGRSIWLHEIYMKLLIVGDAFNNETTVNNALRLALVLDNEPCGADPTVGDIFAQTSNPNSFRNLYYARRFKVLRDVKYIHRTGYVWDSTAGQVDVTESSRYVDVSFKFKTPIRIEYGGTAGTVADMTDKNIVLCMISQGGQPTHIKSSMSKIRMRFTDNPGLRQGPTRRYGGYRSVLGKRTLYPAPGPYDPLFASKRLRGG
jgi:hypothetical protein